jgi:hypothetical protein
VIPQAQRFVGDCRCRLRARRCAPQLVQPVAQMAAKISDCADAFGDPV